PSIYTLSLHDALPISSSNFFEIPYTMPKPGKIDFTMCNPPFDTSIDALLKSAQMKKLPPCSPCTGTIGEMVVEGGEIAFVSKMIQDSHIAHLGNSMWKNTWYTTLLGALSSLTALIPLLVAHELKPLIAAATFTTGRTKRWALAWCWDPAVRPSKQAALYNCRSAILKMVPVERTGVESVIPVSHGRKNEVITMM